MLKRKSEEDCPLLSVDYMIGTVACLVLAQANGLCPSWPKVLSAWISRSTDAGDTIT